jgi:ADP-ribose pyrophosphatase
MSSRSDYYTLVEASPECFANPHGAGFEILLEEAEIQQAEAYMERKLAESGGDPEWARVGIAFRDQYTMIVRDAVRFRDGRLGTYIRMWNPAPNRPGVVVLPLWSRQVLLVRHFRHETRTWHLEIPRGFGVSADSEESARQELREEIQATASRLVDLGRINPSTGASEGSVVVYLAEVDSYGQPEENEGITDILPTPVPEFERMIADGELTDSFLLAAYARAKARRLLE